jgi:hypothetical protein
MGRRRAAGALLLLAAVPASAREVRRGASVGARLRFLPRASGTPRVLLRTH